MVNSIVLCIVLLIFLTGVIILQTTEAFQDPPQEVGFMMTRCVRQPHHNTLYKESYESIRRYHPELKIIIIDDNSDKGVLEEYPMTNVEVIQSEYPAAGEYLCYWYLLQRKPFKKAIFIQDSMILNGPIPYHTVEDYMFLYEIGNVTGYADDARRLLENTKNPEELLTIFDSGNWRGCWGSMMVITGEYIEKLEEKVGISRWVTQINNRGLRIGLESAIGVACISVQPNKEQFSLFGPSSEMNVMKYPGNEKHTLDMYLADKTMIKDNIIKIWNGR
jgi:hypothetical protein